MKYRICAALLAASAAFGLSGCMTDDYGYGGGISMGYGEGYYGDPYWGWYDDYYYPGTGYYVYDRGGGRHAWNDSQRRYWEGRRGNRPGRENWNGFRGNNGGSAQAWQQRRDSWRTQPQQQGAMGSGSWQQHREAWRGQQGSAGGATPSRGGWRGRGDSWRDRHQ